MSEENYQVFIQRCSHDTENPYIMIRKATLEDPNLSIEAKGTLAYLLSKQNDWKICLSHLIKVLNVGKDKVYKILKNLIESGYVKKEYILENNLKRGVLYHLSEMPRYSEPQKFEAPEKRNPRKSEPQKSETPPLLNTNTSITKEYKNTNIVPQATALAEHLLKKYNEFRESLNEKPMPKETLTSNWLKEAQRLLKKYSEEKIKSLIDFAFQDKFWRKVIKSPAGIRKNFNVLEDLFAEKIYSAENEKKFFELNKKWILDYCRQRERIGAMGNLEYNSTNAWDSRGTFKWSLTDENLQKKITDFYKNYR